MDSDFVKNVARDNWYLVALLVLIAVALAVKFASSKEPEPGAASTAAPAMSAPSAAEARPTPTRLTEREQVLATIQEHQDALDTDPEAEDAPARRNAMGNLYLQKFGDYEEAARCFELVLHDYPDWPGIRGVYPKLATCHERMGDSERAREVYREMMDAFPEDSQEHQFAKDEAGY